MTSKARVRVLAQHLLLDELGEPLGGRAVVGRDRLVRVEDLEERNPGAPSARDRRIVVADAVVNRPCRERQDSRDDAYGCQREPPAPRDVRDERRDDRQRQQDLIRRANEHEQGEPGSDHHEATGRGPIQRACETQRPHGQPGREHRVARGLVVEGRVRRIHEKQQRAEERRDAPEDQRRRAPRQDRGGIQHREHELEEPDAAEIERKPDDERCERRAEDLKLRKRRLGVEQLEVVREVVPRVPSLGHRPPERLHPVDDECDEKQSDGRPSRGHELEHAGEEAAHRERPLRTARPARDTRRRSRMPILASKSSILRAEARP